MLPFQTASLAPGGLMADITQNRVLLKWEAYTDDRTPSKGRTYYIRIGTDSSGDNIVFPYSHKDSGKRMINCQGNADHILYKVVRILAPVTYYCSMHAIDNSNVGSEWVPEQKSNLLNVNTNEFEQSRFKVYPNPTTSIFKIECLHTNQKSKITIHTIDGKLIRKKITNSTTETIDNSDQASGTYLLSISKQSFKIWKE